MDEKLLGDIAKNLNIIGRALVYPCLSSPTMNGASVGRQALFLKAFGLDNTEIAALLGTTPGTVAVRMTEEKKGMKKNKHKTQKNREKA